MATRTAFLSAESHRIRFVYLPKHTSWLNQIECWFSILGRRLLKRSSFNSTTELQEKILNFIDYFNRTMAKPFVCKFQGFLEGV
jgi:putative transposase